MFGSVRGAVCTPTRPGRVTADDDPQPTDLVDAAPLPFRSFAALHTVPVGAEAAVLGLVVGATGPESVLTRRGRTTLRATLSLMDAEETTCAVELWGSLAHLAAVLRRAEPFKHVAWVQKARVRAAPGGGRVLASSFDSEADAVPRDELERVPSEFLATARRLVAWSRRQWTRGTPPGRRDAGCAEEDRGEPALGPIVPTVASEENLDLARDGDFVALVGSVRRSVPPRKRTLGVGPRLPIRRRLLAGRRAGSAEVELSFALRDAPSVAVSLVLPTPQLALGDALMVHARAHSTVLLRPVRVLAADSPSHALRFQALPSTALKLVRDPIGGFAAPERRFVAKKENWLAWVASLTFPSVPEPLTASASLEAVARAARSLATDPRSLEIALQVQEQGTSSATVSSLRPSDPCTLSTTVFVRDVGLGEAVESDLFAHLVHAFLAHRGAALTFRVHRSCLVEPFRIEHIHSGGDLDEPGALRWQQG